MLFVTNASVPPIALAVKCEGPIRGGHCIYTFVLAQQPTSLPSGNRRVQTRHQTTIPSNSTSVGSDEAGKATIDPGTVRIDLA